MCKLERIVRKLAGLAVVPLLLSGLAGQKANGQVSCGCDTVSCGISFANQNNVGVPPSSTVAAGTTITATVSIAPQCTCPPPNAGSSPCEFHHGTVTLVHPDGFVETLTTDLPQTQGCNNPIFLTSTHPDTLTSSGTVTWSTTYTGGSWITSGGEVPGASTTCSQPLTVVSPRICITKQCVLPTGQTCFLFGQPVTVSATIENCGDEALGGISLTDSAGCAFDTIPADTVLQPGATLTVNATCPVQGNGCAHTDTVTVNATSATTTTPVTATSDPATTCPICDTPCLVVTKDCQPRTITLGQSYTITATVRNCGNIPLINVTVTDSILGTLGTIDRLDPSDTATPLTPQTYTPTVCAPSTDTVSATELTFVRANP
jgi:uncharacterized repeat protein (TIGR01451 family)